MPAKSPQTKRKTNRKANGGMPSPTHPRKNTSESPNRNGPQSTVIVGKMLVRGHPDARSDSSRHLPELDLVLPTSAEIADRRFQILEIGAGPSAQESAGRPGWVKFRPAATVGRM